jgi:hypothetical protein
MPRLRFQLVEYTRKKFLPLAMPAKRSGKRRLRREMQAATYAQDYPQIL